MALTYKTEHIVEKIDAPIICVIDGVETEYESGAAMYADRKSTRLNSSH